MNQTSEDRAQGNKWGARISAYAPQPCPFCGLPVEQPQERPKGGRPREFHRECKQANWHLEQFLQLLDEIQGVTPEKGSWLKNRFLSYVNEFVNRAGKLKKL